jgi:hypothetical protein
MKAWVPYASMQSTPYNLSLRIKSQTTRNSLPVALCSRATNSRPEMTTFYLKNLQSDSRYIPVYYYFGHERPHLTHAEQPYTVGEPMPELGQFKGGSCLLWSMYVFGVMGRDRRREFCGLKVVTDDAGSTGYFLGVFVTACNIASGGRIWNYCVEE